MLRSLFAAVAKEESAFLSVDCVEILSASTAVDFAGVVCMRSLPLTQGRNLTKKYKNVRNIEVLRLIYVKEMTNRTSNSQEYKIDNSRRSRY
jgi:hypothetical protein